MSLQFAAEDHNFQQLADSKYPVPSIYHCVTLVFSCTVSIFYVGDGFYWTTKENLRKPLSLEEVRDLLDGTGLI